MNYLHVETTNSVVYVFHAFSGLQGDVPVNFIVDKLLVIGDKKRDF